MSFRRRMNAAKRRKRGGKGRSGRQWLALAQLLFRSQTVGVLFTGIALLTLISLPGAEEGVFTRWWIGNLRAAFGVGVYLVPVIFGVTGFWLVMRSVKVDGLDWRRPTGLLLGFLAALALAHVFMGEPEAEAALQGEGGGILGRWIGQTLIDALGVIPAVALLVVAAGGALILIAQQAFHRFALFLREQVMRGVHAWQDRRLSRGLALPSGKLSWRKRAQGWFQRLRQYGVGEGPSAHEPLPSAPTRATPAVRGAGDEATRAASQAAAPLPGRVIGGAQEWQLPVISEVLEEAGDTEISQEEIRQRARIIEETLASFGVPVKVVEVNQGPAVTQFGLQPGYIERRSKDGRIKQVKVKVSRIQALANDLALALSASPIRIEAPVPGRPIVGIEVPNVQTSLVSLRGLLESEEFQSMSAPLRIALGRDVSGRPVVMDLAAMPHLLIAGATGSGKSVCINAIIATLLCTHTPDTLRFLMIDPKRVELTGYNGIPHLIAPVVVDIERVVNSLRWATREMERRYKLFSKVGARNIESYNRILSEHGEALLPYIVIVVDELADLMMAAPEEVEQLVCRLAQMARATGIHLIIATQRPSVDVVTGLIKANFPARIAFAVVSQVDSRVILDAPGAERLLGRGDMLFMRPDSSKLERLQGAYVSDRELERLVRYWKGMRVLEEPEDVGAAGVRGLATAPQVEPGQAIQRPLWEEMIEQANKAAPRDDLYEKAVEVVREEGRASVSLLQRRLRIGYSRAARLIDMMEEAGIVGPDEGGPRGRKVLLDKVEQTETAEEPVSGEDSEVTPPRVWF